MHTAATHEISWFSLEILSTSAAFVGRHFTVHPTFHDMNHECEHCSIQHPISIHMFKSKTLFGALPFSGVVARTLAKSIFGHDNSTQVLGFTVYTVRISTNASKHPSSIHTQIHKSYIQTESPFLVKPSDPRDLHRKGTVKVAFSTLQFWLPAISKRQTLVNL